MIKGIVNRAAVKGMAETVTGVVSILQQEMSLNKKETHTVPKSKEPHATADDAKTESAQGKTSSWSTLAMVFICFLMAMYQISIQLKYQSLYNGSSIVWRGVYLRDVEEHVLHKDITLGYINPR
jgi:hypothetical protein